MDAKELRRRQKSNQAVARCIPVLLICAVVYASWVFVGPLCGEYAQHGRNRLVLSLTVHSGLPPQHARECSSPAADRARHSSANRLLLPPPTRGSIIFPPSIRRHFQPGSYRATPSTPRAFAEGTRLPRPDSDNAFMRSYDYIRSPGTYRLRLRGDTKRPRSSAAGNRRILHQGCLPMRLEWPSIVVSSMFELEA
jgi:hypothetical protein